MVKITGVLPHGKAARHGIKKGDVLVSVNGNDIRDVLDYRFYLTEARATLQLTRDGVPFETEIFKGEYEDIGLEFETPLMDKKHACKNGCIFCFIDQNPKGMRDSIYFKDDDSRLSFLHGNYITLTNMTEEDVRRIIRMRMSPINISVHTTDPELRVRMMKNKNAGKVLSYLDEFKAADLSMCGQIVLCRGWNDGAALERTLTDLSRYAPQMSSVSIVPAGLTGHREGLCPLSDFTAQEASDVIDAVDRIGEKMLADGGSRMFFAADEFYLKSGREIPPESYYEDYPQLENGVGMIRSFTEDVKYGLQNTPKIAINRTVSVATGVAAYPTILAAAREVQAHCPGLRVNVRKVINHFFGESITVAGLLTGRDLSQQLAGEELGEELLIPSSMLRAGEDVFLCGMHVNELSEKLGVAVRAVAPDGISFAAALRGEK